MPRAKKIAAVKVNSLTRQRPANEPATAPPARFDRRYAKLEHQRAFLLHRLSNLNDKARAHLGHKRALKLLNQTFRRSSLAQRVAVLNAANWSIDLLEQVATRP